MLEKDVVIGMKVVPHRKTAGSKHPVSSNRGCDFLYVNGYEKDHKCYYLDSDKDSGTGDYYNASDFKPYIEPDQPKTLSNSQLWKLAEDGLISDGEKFEYAGEAIFEYVNMMYDDGEFVFIDSLGFTHEVTFCVDDKWIKVPSKHRLTREQAEIEFGIQIID